jgi:hypothetical protein
MPSMAAACCQALLGQAGWAGMERFTAPYVDDTVLLLDDVIRTGFKQGSATLTEVLDRVHKSTHVGLDQGIAMHIATLLILMAVLTIS